MNVKCSALDRTNLNHNVSAHGLKKLYNSNSFIIYL